MLKIVDIKNYDGHVRRFQANGATETEAVDNTVDAAIKSGFMTRYEDFTVSEVLLEDEITQLQAENERLQARKLELN
jgi:hypothetical protein